MIEEAELERRIALWKQGYWEIPDGLDTSNFDFTWRPEPYDRPYVHQFGTQHQKTGGPKFVVPDNEGIKYQSFQHAINLPNINNRSWRPLITNCTIDFSWHPDDTEPPFIYVFGNQWYDVDVMPTYQYRVKGATKKKFMYDVTAKLTPNLENWIIPDDISDDFDYSWLPHPHEPPFIWQFGTQWQKSGGPAYVAKGAEFKKYCDLLTATKLPNENRNWRPLKAGITFDYSWHPDENEPPYIYVFGNQHYGAEVMPTVLYRVKGAKEKKFVTDIHAQLPIDHEFYEKITTHPIDFDYSWVPNPNDPPYIYVFGNQWYDSREMPSLLYKTPGASKPKYVNDIVTTIVPDMTKWIVPDDIEEGFDYSWVPDPKEPPYVWQFGTQWQKSGGPAYVAEEGAPKKYTNELQAIKKPNMRNWRIIEHINKETFDFSWHPDETEDNFMYIFGNKYHSPEIMPTLAYKSKQTVGNKFVEDIKADLEIETIEYTDSIFDSVIKSKFTSAYAHFVKGTSKTSHNVIKNDNISIHLSGDEAIVPRSVKMYLYDKLTDYEHVVKHKSKYKPKLLDIVFFSNGETCAEDNYDYLISLNLPNRIVRVDGVQGRVASQHAAANASNTDWYFLVNAKLRVNKDFDFTWQPNIYKSSRHYIFTATNPVNELEYGHMAIVANNKKLTLNTIVRGLDFTLDSKHEVVKKNSGVAMFNSSEWDAWRTAFRECIKLSYAKDKESRKRLKVWSTVAEGEFAEYSIQGAKDAIEYYESVNGALDKLMLSYDWEWLRNYYNGR